MNECVNPEQRTRRFRLTHEIEMTSEDHLITVNIEQIFSTASGKKIDAHLLKSNFEWIDRQEEEEQEP